MTDDVTNLHSPADNRRQRSASSQKQAQHIVLFVYYFAPVSSSGAKRMEAMAKYFTRAGRRVTVVTQTKSTRDGLLIETPPAGITVFEIDRLGRLRASPQPARGDGRALRQAPRARGLTRRVKDWTLRTTGQLIDPRLPFAWSIRSPWLAPEVKAALRSADVVVGTSPPWPPLRAALNAARRFGLPAVLDYRDHLSCCHEMPGTRAAKRLEIALDRNLGDGADSIVTVSDPMRRYYSQFNDDVSVVLNGYDGEAVEAARTRAPWVRRPAGSPLRIRYLGIITTGRLPHDLLSALDRLHKGGDIAPDKLILEFYGNCELLRKLIDARYPHLQPYFAFFAAVGYSLALELSVSADHLLFCERMIPPLPGQEASAEGILPTKLYEYLASGRPIIGNIDPSTLAGQFITAGSARHLVSRDAEEFVAYMKSPAFWEPETVQQNDFVRTLSREIQARRYLSHLDDVVSRSGREASQ